MIHSGEETKKRELDNIRFNLRQLEYLFNDPKLTDIFCSKEGKISFKKFGKDIENSDIILPVSQRFQLLNQIAKYMELNINFFEYPVLEGTIPVPEWKNARITAIFPPWIAAPSFTIRKPPEKIYTLEDYVANGQLSQERYETIVKYIKENKNIIVAGGTGSGKTTLVNAIIKKKCEFYPRHRYYIVQDVSELQCEGEYADMPVIRSDQATLAVLLSLRYTPNCIIFGEVRKGAVMAELLDAWNTGHPGGVTTIHANSSAATLTRIKKLLLDHYPSEASLPDLNEYIDIIIYIQKDRETGITINEIMEMKKNNGLVRQLG
ncbi:MAG: Flp pilus assembly complex ATPase component TadA [Treponema sp.]|jgi:type IV secretion system protein VirB11|nr:Flp pilus assembly complex ATPase component TadA [Treponema sp.]